MKMAEKSTKRVENAVAKGEITYKAFPKQALVFMCLKYKPFENTVGKGEIARNEQFLISPQCVQHVWRTFCHFRKI